MQDVGIETEAPNYFKKPGPVCVKISEHELKKRSTNSASNIGMIIIVTEETEVY